MREIKFRGKSVATGDWIYGYLVPMLNGDGGWAITGEHFLHREDDEYGDLLATEEYCQVLDDTIGQYTTLTDYGNTPVFEGDILEGTERGIVRYGNHPPHISHSDDTSVGFYIEWLGEKAGTYRTDIGYWLGRSEACFVTGNIYDDPGLIGGLE